MGGVVHRDVEALAPEGLVHGEAVPFSGDGGADNQAVGGGTQAQDTLHAAHHHGRGGAGQPMHMAAAGLGRLVALDELAVHVGLDLAQLRAVVVGRGAGLGEVLEGAAAVAHQGLGQDRPALGLAEDAAVLLGGGVEQLHQRAVEVVLLVAGRHDLNAPAYSVYSVDEKVIDEVNILNATHMAMNGAVDNLSTKADYVLIDGNSIKNMETPHETVVKGDAKSISIAAASILAKVSRDRYITEISEKYPEYGFEKHKGYGTKVHNEAILKYGPSPIHRKTFLKKLLGDKI